MKRPATHHMTRVKRATPGSGVADQFVLVYEFMKRCRNAHHEPERISHETHTRNGSQGNGC